MENYSDDQKVQTLKGLFPNLDESVVVNVLQQYNWDVNVSVEPLMDLASSLVSEPEKNDQIEEDRRICEKIVELEQSEVSPSGSSVEQSMEQEWNVVGALSEELEQKEAELQKLRAQLAEKVSEEPTKVQQALTDLGQKFEDFTTQMKEDHPEAQAALSKGFSEFEKIRTQALVLIDRTIAIIKENTKNAYSAVKTKMSQIKNTEVPKLLDTLIEMTNKLQSEVKSAMLALSNKVKRIDNVSETDKKIAEQEQAALNDFLVEMKKKNEECQAVKETLRD